MILHYLKLTLRNLIKDLTNSIINLGGLTLALSCTFLIFLFVLNELSTDSFHEKSENIYRAYIKFKVGDEERAYNSTSLIFAENIKPAFPEINNVARIYSYDHFYGGQYIHHNDELIRADKFFIIDQAFFDVFSFRVILGDRDKLILNNQSLVLTETMADKFFPGENPIGQSLSIEDTRGEHEFIITGVVEDFPSNSTIKANFLGNIDLASEHIRGRGWGISATSSFIKFNTKIDIPAFEAKLNNFAKEHHPDKNYSYAIQPLSDIYFHSDFFPYYNMAQGNYKEIGIFALIGLAILLIVSINYIILNIGKSSQRLTEIGVKKVFGATRNKILLQVLIESLIFTFIAFPVAIMISELVLPYYNTIMGKDFDLSYSQNFPYIIGIFLVTVFVGLISGSYISVYLLAFSPDQIFKKRFSNKQERFTFKKFLLVFQLLAFIVLVVFSFVAALQVKYMNDVDLGYQDENLVVIHPPHDHSLFTCRSFINEAIRNPSVVNISEVYGGLYTSAILSDKIVLQESESEIDFSILRADDRYISTMGIQIVSGRDFYPESTIDSASIIINRTAARVLGFDDPVGEMLTNNTGENYQIIGVVDDFYTTSLHTTIPPVGIMLKRTDDMVTQIMVKLNPKNQSKIIASLEENWNNLGPNNSKFEYEFWEDVLRSNYSKDSNFSTTINVFTGIAILIASLGVFGFSFYNAKRRTKEIGIRKVFGGTPGSIGLLFSNELLLLIFIANVIAIPVAFILSQKWLNNYAFHIELPFWIFLVTPILSLFIILISSGISILKAARKNPVDSLRYE